MDTTTPPPSQPAPSSRGAGAPPGGPPSVRQTRLQGPLPPPPPEPGRKGFLALVAAVALAPIVLLGVAFAVVPRFRPWVDAPPPPGEATGKLFRDREEGPAIVRGRVVDEDGHEVQGATVRVLGPPPTFVRHREGQTVERGAFSFSELRPGRVRVWAEHEHKGIVVSAELSLTEGSRIDDLVLALQPARTVKGRVSAEDGSAVAGASLEVEGVSWVSRTGTSGADGGYEIAQVPIGARSLRVVARGFSTEHVSLRHDVAEGAELVDVKLRRVPDLEGVVLDPDGKPIIASVVACDGKLPEQRTISDAQGKFRFAADLASCSLYAMHDAFTTSDTARGKPGEPVTLQLRQGGSVRGVVVDEAGAPVASFQIGVESFVPAVGDRNASVRSGAAQAFNDPGGAFFFERLAPGTYVLTASADGKGYVRSPRIEVSAGHTTTGIKMQLVPGGTVEGTVLDEAKKTPVAGARISFDAVSSTRSAPPAITTDDAGRFKLENAPDGPFTLRVEREGYTGKLVSGLRVSAREVLEREIVLRPAGDGGAGLEFAGVGASVVQTRDGIAFAEVYVGSPAERAGVQQGDLVRKIDGVAADSMSVADAIQRLRGEVGTPVHVSVVRPSTGQPLEATIVRALIAR